MGESADRPARANALFHEVQAVLGGHSEAAAIQALLHSLVVMIGTGATDLPHARAQIDALPDVLKPMLRSGWLGFRAHRAKMDADTQSESGG